jgi:hypothetical protein
MITTFRDRSAEWVLSLALTGWGLGTLLSPNLFETRDVFIHMLDIMPQNIWGGLALLFGLIRIIFLFINGAWRPSAHIRVLGCLFGCLTWGMLLISSIQPEVINTPTTELYGALLVLDLLSIWFASGDAKLADIDARERRK